MKKRGMEKPAYHVWQNTVYVVKSAWHRDKTVLFVILAQMFLTVAISTVSMYLPKTVVWQITSGVPVQMLAATVLAFTAVIVILQAVKNYLDSNAQPKRVWLRLNVCHDILGKVMEADYANLEEQKFADLRQKANDVTNNNASSTEAIYSCLSGLGINLLGFVVYVILLVSVNPLILLITAATTVFGVIVRRWVNKWRHNHDKESAVFNKRLWYLNSVGQNYELAKDIRMFAMVDWLKDIYAANMKLAFDFDRKVQMKLFLADAVDCFATFLREGLAYAYLIWQVLYSGMSIDSFILLFAAIGGFSGWIMGILNEYSSLSMHSLNYCRLRSFLEYPDKFHYESGQSLLPETGKKYSIEFRNVSFRYGGAEENALENINLTIAPCEKLAVVGLNGAGKTTFVKLLCGLYDPTEGEILLNGKDIREYNRKQYYALFTAVFQEFNILPCSIAENVSQLNRGEIDRERLRRCLQLADIDQKVNSLTSGADSLLIKNVNDDAVEFSGGETQKLMLARALYKDSPILVLDEPTAALDPIAESRLYGRYNEFSAGKTSVYISHRLASTRFCDRIILLHNKTIAECGTHKELMEAGGKYAGLFEIQSRYYKEGHEEGETA